MSNDEKKYTEKDLILAKREGWMKHCGQSHSFLSFEARQRDAATEFPLPKITRPRVVSDGLGRTWRYNTEEEELQACIDGYWSCPRDYYPTKRVVTLWADLIANPTVTVEGDA